jgi:DMSO/TMAO reductase YedYZ molybdopterin-dependent catalytic subunit
MAVQTSPLPDRARDYGRTGALAALLALFLDLLWRATIAPAGVSAIPELVVAAVARLTPTSFFGWATENFGSLAQNTLFAVILLAIVLVGHWAGQLAGARADSGWFGGGTRGRLLAVAIVGVVLFAFIAGAVMPIAREGFFGAGSAYRGQLLLQAALFAAIWAVTWGALSGTPRMASSAGTTGAASVETVSRRAALRTGASAVLAAAVAVLGWRLAKSPDAGDTAASEEAAAQIAARARESEPAPSIFAAQSGTPVPVEVGNDKNADAVFAQLEGDGQLTPVITSVANFYHVSKNIGDPVVDSKGWTLTVGGMVANPLSLTYDDLVARAKTRNITTLSCISNELNGDLASTAEWTGLPLRELLEEAKIDPSSVDVVFRAADGYDDSIPFAVAMAPTTMLVTGMNGEALPSDHGFPARLIVPPIYGMKNVKWLQQIEAVNNDYKGYWETRGWSDTAIYQIWGRIDTPSSGQELQPGAATAAGVAAAGNRGILRVEISLDGGATWGDADLEPSINPNFTWVRWVFPFVAKSGTLNILMRATDGEGTVAPSEYSPPLPDGATGWPQRTVRVA